MLTQADVIERRQHDDDVAFGGWSIDLHPADGVFAERAGSHHLYSKGIYPIPYRCYYSRNIKNLFLAGRIISATHVAFGSTRVMATCALGGQAVAVAAALCKERDMIPRDVLNHLPTLQTRLLRTGQHVPGVPLQDPDDLATGAEMSATRSYELAHLPADGDRQPPGHGVAQLLPLPAGRAPKVTFFADVAEATTVEVELRTTSDPRHHTPDVLLASAELELPDGENVSVPLDFDVNLPKSAYGYYIVQGNPHMTMHHTRRRVTGLLTAWKGADPADFREVGGDTFDWWRVQRRPGGQNLACAIEPPLAAFGVENLKTGFLRPTHKTNAWVADPEDDEPALTLTWGQPQSIDRIELWFDADYDHAMESVLMGHPESVVPFCVRDYVIRDADGNELHRCSGNYQTINRIRLEEPVKTKGIGIELDHPSDRVPAALFGVRVYRGEQ